MFDPFYEAFADHPHHVARTERQIIQLQEFGGSNVNVHSPAGRLHYDMCSQRTCLRIRDKTCDRTDQIDFTPGS